MGDFELAIINACKQQFPTSKYTCCFFHFTQSVYRKIQESGLQADYNNPEDRDTKVYTHMLMALAFVPIEDVQCTFRLLKDALPNILLPISEYLGEYYVLGRLGRGRRRAVAPRYPVPIWNQYQATLDGEQKTNNSSEGWHNRFRLVVGKHHPDLYTALLEIQKEQADLEIAIAELSLGRTVKAAPKKKWKDAQIRITGIVHQYAEYKADDNVLEYLKAIAHNISI